jgi:hypothetical protein
MILNIWWDRDRRDTNKMADNRSVVFSQWIDHERSLRYCWREDSWFRMACLVSSGPVMIQWDEAVILLKLTETAIVPQDKGWSIQAYLGYRVTPSNYGLLPQDTLLRERVEKCCWASLAWWRHIHYSVDLWQRSHWFGGGVSGGVLERSLRPGIRIFSPRKIIFYLKNNFDYRYSMAWSGISNILACVSEFITWSWYEIIKAKNVLCWQYVWRHTYLCHVMTCVISLTDNAKWRHIAFRQYL